MKKNQLEFQLKDLKIKYQNLSVAKQISEDSLKEEINDYKKELLKKDKQIDSMFETIRKLDAKVDSLTEQVNELTRENKILKETVEKQNDQLSKLKSRINKDSNNSDKPSSTNGFKKPIQNSRERTGKSIGGQIGHKGYWLNQFKNAQEIIDKKIEKCTCGGTVINSNDYTAKQIVDIRFSVDVKEERVYNGVCSKCGRIHEGEFSENYINPVQYGNRLKSFVALLNNHGFISTNRIVEIISSITENRINISEGTVINIQKDLSGKLDLVVNQIKENLIESKVLCADETGCRVNSKTSWIQVFCNDRYTLFGYHKKRGSAAIEDIGILDYFVGILVHDHFSAYYKNEMATHAECNAHILRYLKSILELFKHEWAKEMIEFFVTILKSKKEKLNSNKSFFTQNELDAALERYDQILNKGQTEYEEAIKGKKNISYYNDERLLLKRLQEFKKEHLLFITNFDAPFDNNQAERDIRLIKTKMKVSGCFRSDTGINAFTKIYSFISTLKKQKRNILENILKILNDNEVILE